MEALPDDILCRIFDGFDLKKLVKFSGFGKRWRHLYQKVQKLNFSSEIESVSSELLDFVFTGNDSTVESFAVDYCVAEDLGGWWIRIISPNLKECKLRVLISTMDWTLPEDLLDCSRLKLLHLEQHSDSVDNLYLNLDNGLHLPSLISLSLKRVFFEGINLLTEIFNGCPILKYLSLDYCHYDPQDLDITSDVLQHLIVQDLNPLLGDFSRTINITAPNLKIFQYVDYACNLYHTNVEEKAYLGFRFLDDLILQEQYDGEFVRNLLESVKDVKELTLMEDTLEVISRNCYVLPMDPLFFDNLRQLKVGSLIARNSGHRFKALVNLLMICPILESLDIDMCNNEDEDDEAEAEAEARVAFEKVVEQVPPQLKISHLKLIEIRNVKGCYTELLCLGFLLNKALNLKEMVLCHDNPNGLSGFFEKLRALPRASSTVLLRDNFSSTEGLHCNLYHEQLETELALSTLQATTEKEIGKSQDSIVT